MMARFTVKAFLVGLAVLALGVVSAPARAAASDPAAARIESFQQTLLDTMRSGGDVRGRYTKLEPAVQHAFDLPAMARFSVGPQWSKLSSADQAAIVKAFSRMSIAQYAHNFDSFNGQKFTLDPNVQERGSEKLVKSKLVSSGSTPTTFVYRMRSKGGDWKVIDVFYDGSVSQLTTLRADFSSTLKGGGAEALVKKLDSLADKLMS